jgi:hypothetical protein
MVFKEKVAETIKLPQFLQVPMFANKDEAIDLVWSILDYYFQGCQDTFLTDKDIETICDCIDDLSSLLSDIITSKLYLQCWLFIGKTINQWIEFALQEELYEVATNLRKILNKEYA